MRSETETTYVLHLTEEEAMLLKGLVQNPSTPDEPEDITKLRAEIFNALRDCDPFPALSEPIVKPWVGFPSPGI